MGGQMVIKLILICLGSGIGAVLRNSISAYITNRNKEKIKKDFPLHTFIVNMIGTFLLALSYLYMSDENLISFFQLGFCGGFTTYSTVFNEVISLSEKKKRLLSIIYLVTSILAGSVKIGRASCRERV